MSYELNIKLLAQLPPIDVKEGDFGKTLEDNPLERQLFRLAAVSLDQETEGLRAILDALGKTPKRKKSSTPP
jgi:hypothetical protein